MAKINVKELYDTCNRLVSTAEQYAGRNEKIPDEIITALRKAYEQIFEFETVALIKATDRFYGTVLMGMSFELDFTQRGAVDLKINRNPMALTVNPLFLKNYTFAEFTGLIVNEIIKMVWLHPALFGKLNSGKDPGKHKKLEEASSAASTTIVKRDIRLDFESTMKRVSNICRLPEGLSSPTTISKKAGVGVKDDQPLEYYYKILERLKDQDQDDNQNGQQMSQQGQSQNGQQMPQQGQNQNDQDQDGGQDQQQANSQNQQQAGSGGGGGQGQQMSQQGQNQNGQGGGSSQPDPNGIATTNNQNGQGCHQWEGSDEEETREAITSIVANAYNSLDDRHRGMIPSSILQQIKVLLQPPEINWKQILRKMVGAVPVPYRKTKTRLNRRQPFRADLSGRLPKRTVEVVCAFDTSGSMSDDDLRYCINEVFNILKNYEGYKVTIIECDAEIQRIYEARSMADVKTKMKGRGGTSYIPVIRYINGEKPYDNPYKYPKAGKFKDALLVYFTDGYGDYEIPKPRTYRNLWCVLQGEENLSVKNPYGEVKALMKDKDFAKRRM